MSQFYKNIKNKIIINVRQFVFDLNDKFPFIGRPLVMTWKILCDIKFIIGKGGLKLNARLKYSTDKLDFNKICWVDPQKIEYCLDGNFNIWHNHCRVLKGDWDKNKLLKFEDLDVYQAFKQRFEEGKKWEETKFYHRVLGRISDGRRKWGCKNKEEFHERLKKIESLFYKIKENGYKSKKELYSPKGLLGKLEMPSAILDDVSVAIGRNGQLLFVNGRHRLSIAKLLNLSKIPIRVIARHKKWMDFRKELIAFCKNYQGGELYQSLTHPDLQDIPFRRGDSRFKIIKENLLISKGTLLDIGANLGYFCHRFEDEGLDCYALEENRMCVHFLKKLKKAENRKFKIIPKSVFEYNKGQEIVFDVVLALSVFHHFLERKDTYLNLIKLLKRFKVKEMFFESHLPSDFKTRKFYQNYAPDQFVNFIIKNSCFNKAVLIGKAKSGRPLYKLTSLKQ
jgi:hypothetical protein